MTTNKNQPDPGKVAALKQALKNYQPGEGSFFDREAEEAKAKVRNRALGLLDQRARSRSELEGRLIKAEFEPRLVVEVCDDLERAGLLDDAQFAREWVRQRAARRGKATKALDLELRDKGVAADIRQEALDQIDPSDEEATARALAAKKARSIKTEPADYQEKQKALRRIVGVLARRGFPEGMSLRIAREALDERLDELRDGD